MVVTLPAGMVRWVGGRVLIGPLVRRADAGLASGAARNAASGVRDHQTRRLDEARTMRDLSRLLEGGPVRVAQDTVR